MVMKPDGAADDVNDGAEGTRSAGGEEAGDDGLGPVAKCRDRSKSLWIHFPHVELLFILYAFQGALAAQIDVLRHGSGALVPVAAIALVRMTRTLPHTFVLCDFSQSRSGPGERGRRCAYQTRRCGLGHLD